jgi:STE24 endopeptidase
MNSAATSSTVPQDPGRAYTKQLRWVGELRFLAFFLSILAYGLLGVHKWSASVAQAVTHNFYLQIAFCWTSLWIVCALASLPASLYRFYLDRKFQIANSGLRPWLRDLLKAYGLGYIFGAATIEIAFVLTTLLPSYGWMLAGILYSFLLLAINRSMPWLLSLFYPLVPLSDNTLEARLAGLAAKARLRLGTVYEWRISERTRGANALVTGIGSSRRILLTDTLISELSQEEVEAIVAHELGHCTLHHIRARLLLQSFIFVAIFYAINFAVPSCASSMRTEAGRIAPTSTARWLLAPWLEDRKELPIFIPGT